MNPELFQQCVSLIHKGGTVHCPHYLVIGFVKLTNGIPVLECRDHYDIPCYVDENGRIYYATENS